MPLLLEFHLNIIPPSHITHQITQRRISLKTKRPERQTSKQFRFHFIFLHSSLLNKTHLFTRYHSQFLLIHPISPSTTPSSKVVHVCPLLVSTNIKRSSQHAHFSLHGLYHERTTYITCHFEISLSFQKSLSLRTPLAKTTGYFKRVSAFNHTLVPSPKP